MFDLIPFRRRSRRMLDMLERFFDEEFFPSFTSGIKVDIKDKGNEYILEAELPGVSKEQIDLSYNNNQLRIAVKHVESVEEKGENYIRRERKLGEMSRSFYIEGIDRERIQASYENGLLTVRLPKKHGWDDSGRIEIL